MSDEILEKLADALSVQTSIMEQLATKAGMSVKAPASVNEAPLLFGDGGLFITPGLERDVITAYVRPRGLAESLPLLPSVTEDPVFGSITGVQGDGASPATNPCDDNPSGFIKGCNLTAQFGRIAFDTNTIEFDKVMLQVNRGVTTDLTLRGRLLGMNDINPSGLSDSDVVDLVTASEMVKVGMLMQRGTDSQKGINRMLWQGAIANNTAGGGYKECPGLDAQIATGQVDSIDNVACPAMDSDVKNFNYGVVDANNTDIVNYMQMLEFYLFYNAQRMGLDPVEWCIVMRPELWHVVSEIWPLTYNTYRSEVINTNARVIVNGDQMATETARMRQELVITINGRTHKVVADDGIFEQTNINDGNVPAGSYASSIYFVPLTITGGFPVTYLEHVDYRRGQRDIDAIMGRGDFWTDRGIFSWAIENAKWCYKLSAKIEPRVVLRTPQLAGRIDNVMYAPLQHLRSSDPNSPYNVNGGVSLRSATATYAVWK